MWLLCGAAHNVGGLAFSLVLSLEAFFVQLLALGRGVGVRRIWGAGLIDDVLVVDGKVNNRTGLAIIDLGAVLFLWVIYCANPNPFVELEAVYQ